MPDRSSGRDLLSRKLRDLRTAAELRQVDAAELAGTSQSLIAKFENGQQIPRVDQVKNLCEAYRASSNDRASLIQMAEDLRAGSRRVLLRREASSAQKKIGRIYAQSAQIRSFANTGIHGLLQTPEYCRALFEADPNLSPEAVESGVSARLANQRILSDSESPQHFRIVLTDGALGVALLPPEGMRAQMMHLADASRLPNLELGIIPWGRLSPVLALHPWELYDERAVIVGTATATAILTERPDVDRYLSLMRQLEDIAEFGDAARDILTEAAARYGVLADG